MHAFLPDLCRLPVVFGVLAITQLLVIIYVLSLNHLAAFDWSKLSLISFYTQWISMLSIAGLCSLRKAINRLSLWVSAMTSFVWIIVVVFLVNTAAQWIYGSNSWNSWNSQWLWRDLFIYSVIAGIALRYLYIQQQWRYEQQATQNATLDALHARIRPHFLFNSMNTIASLIRYEPVQAEEAVEDLAALFRATLSDSRQITAWSEELAICQAYCRIEKLRLGDRLSVNWDLDNMPSDFKLPALILQPLLENAIYHGIEKRPEGGEVCISVDMATDSSGFNEVVVLKVCNPIADHAAFNNFEADSSQVSRHNGLALDNIRARLASLYRHPDSGNQLASLGYQKENQQYCAELRIPLNHSSVDSGSSGVI